jgi:4-azaleucine resistance transporter AzlC
MSESAPAAARIVFTRVGFWRGMRACLPLLIGLTPFALVTGVLAQSKRFSLLEAVVMSALVYAGAAQLLALELWRDPPDLLIAALAVFVVNIRMAPMGAALSFWLDHLRGWKLWGTLLTLVDHSFAMSVTEHRAGGRDAAYLLGVGLGCWAVWVLGTGLGHAFGASVQLPRGHPLFLAGTVTFCAMLVALWRGARRDLLGWVVAGLVAYAAWRLGWPAPLPLITGALAGSAVAAAQELRR